MLKEIIDKLASRPKIFIFLRKLLENNFKTQKEVIVKYLSFDDAAPVLDIGCGTGEFSVFFKPENYIGIDIEKEYIDFARRNYAGRFLLGDAGQLPFADNSFLKVLIVGVLHHLNNKQAKDVLAEAKRVLSPNGQMLVLEDLNSSSNNFLTNFIHKLDKGKFIRTEQEYKALIESYFKILETFRLKSGLGAYQVFLLKKND